MTPPLICMCHNYRAMMKTIVVNTFVLHVLIGPLQHARPPRPLSTCASLQFNSDRSCEPSQHMHVPDISRLSPFVAEFRGTCSRNGMSGRRRAHLIRGGAGGAVGGRIGRRQLQERRENNCTRRESNCTRRANSREERRRERRAEKRERENATDSR